MTQFRALFTVFLCAPKIFERYWQFNYDASGQTGFFLKSHFEYFCLTSFFPQHLRHTVRPTVEYLRFQKLFLCLFFFMMSEARWTAVQNVCIGKRSIVIKLPVITFVFEYKN